MKYNGNERLIGIRIMQKRKEKGYTQEKLSELMGISSGQLSCIERGEYSLTTQNLFKLCELLGGSPNYYLVGEIDEENGEKIISLVKMLPKTYQDAVEKSIELYVDAFIKELHN